MVVHLTMLWCMFVDTHLTMIVGRRRVLLDGHMQIVYPTSRSHRHTNWVKMNIEVGVVHNMCAGKVMCNDNAPTHSTQAVRAPFTVCDSLCYWEIGNKWVSLSQAILASVNDLSEWVFKAIQIKQEQV